MIVIESKLAEVLGRSLKNGKHDPDSLMCVMEAVAYVAGEDWTDSPRCACPVISAFMRSWNDSLPNDAERDRLLKPLAAWFEKAGGKFPAAPEPQTSNSLVQRLRSPRPRPGYPDPLPPHPWMVEAADEISRQAQEIERLRAAHRNLRALVAERENGEPSVPYWLVLELIDDLFKRSADETIQMRAIDAVVTHEELQKALSDETTAWHESVPELDTSNSTRRQRMLADEELSDQEFKGRAYRIALEAHEDRLRMWESLHTDPLTGARLSVETDACTDSRGHKFHRPTPEQKWICPSCGQTRETL